MTKAKLTSTHFRTPVNKVTQVGTNPKCFACIICYLAGAMGLISASIQES